MSSFCSHLWYISHFLEFTLKSISFHSDLEIQEKIVVKGLFKACKSQTPGTSIYEDGLTLQEVMQQSCVDFLTTLFGLEENQIPNDFKKVDTDGDGRVTLKEGRDALNKLREAYYTAGFCDFDCCPKNGQCHELTVIMDEINPDSVPCPDNIGLLFMPHTCTRTN